MVEIAIESTLDVDSSNAVATLHTMRAVDSLLDVDASGAVGDTEYFQVLRAIRSTLDTDQSSAIITPNCNRAVDSTLDVDSSAASLKLNLQKAFTQALDVDSSTAKLAPMVERAIGGTVNVDSSEAITNLNVQHAINSTIETDQSFGEIRYLFLKNPPLPPSGNISLRAVYPVPLKNSPTLIGNSTYTLDTSIVGERLASLHLVFTIRSMRNGQLVPHIQKSSKDTPNSYLEITGGKGDILIQSITPSISSRGITQDLTATIMLLPHDFEKLPNQAGTYQYDLWVYDLLGTNALIESGTIKVVS